MNNRFEQLWKQVTLQECDCGCNPDEYMRMRFAELIIEECVAQCWTVSELESRGFVVSECTKRMRKHFGVE